MRIAWGAKVERAFVLRVVAIAERLGCDASHLMACMAFETGRTFAPDKRNPYSTATGLIQFMETTAAGLGTTTAALARMTRMQQLEYVARYFEPYRGRLKTLSDVYMAILWPAGIGKPEKAVIFPPGSRAALANRGLDLNHDGAVMKEEAASFVAKALAEGMQPGKVYVDAPSTKIAPLIAEEKPVPLLTALLPTVLGLFAPLAQEKLSRLTGQPANVVEPFVSSVMAKVQEVTGKADPVQAVAALAENPEPAKIEAVQASALDYLDKIAPLLDRVEAWDRQAFQDTQAAQAAAAERAKDPVTNVQPQLISFTQWALGASTAFVGVLIALQLYLKGGEETNGQLIGLFIMLVTMFANTFRTQNDYGFGSSRQSAAKDVVISQLANK